MRGHISYAGDLVLVAARLWTYSPLASTQHCAINAPAQLVHGRSCGYLDEHAVGRATTMQRGRVQYHEGFMTQRKLDEIATDLGDMSVTFEEIREQVADHAAPGDDKLDQIHREMIRVGDQIDEMRDDAGRDKKEQPE